MKREHGFRGSARARGAVKLMRSSADDDDDAMLLPSYGSFPFVGTFPPPFSELKFYDTFVGFSAPSSSAALSGGNITGNAGASKVICNPGQGFGNSSREGNCIIAKSLHVKFTLRLTAVDNGTLIPQPRAVFIAIVEDRQSNGAACDGTDVWVNGSGSNQQLMNLHRNPFRGERFVVHRQDIVDMSPKFYQVLDILTPDQTSSAGRIKCLEYFIPLDHKINFKGNAGTIADVDDCSFWVYAFQYDPSAGAGISEPGVELNYTSRVRFLSRPAANN